jgi:hypothetical protein
MKINIYLSESNSPIPRYGFLPPHQPMTLLPRGEKWTYVWSADTKDFSLPGRLKKRSSAAGFGLMALAKRNETCTIGAQRFKPERTL